MLGYRNLIIFKPILKFKPSIYSTTLRVYLTVVQMYMKLQGV